MSKAGTGIAVAGGTGLGMKRRVPQRDRGERRVAEVLEAAAAVIGERGYDAATMTEIAECAGASIGALYQYFPNKGAIAIALRNQYADEMRERWRPLLAQGSRLTVKELVERMFELIDDFMSSRPAYIPLLSATLSFRRDAASRLHIRELFAALYREKQPALTQEAAMRMANVTLQIVKGMKSLYVESKPGDRADVTAEFKLVLTGYLDTRLQG